MGALLPFLASVAPAAGTALVVSAAKGAGQKIGQQVGQQVGQQISSFGQPPGSGQARFQAVAYQQRMPQQVVYQQGLGY